ncbi:hypothetical protein PFICI_11022 [Pestalotiopsis fici W106-1]|uniref:Heterokaryon incompatibility domain-containing protein n=1 Tax=Pestalotiopsis fici (strain W106-1 / CGMCC3.15140) TaxID=1229662 RepID=W3WTF9_PESFW|nr:uncharacterized protein PFICI_11022 [Pestalotiopsis fici W106-1]ETS77148.1 hypothetical protein PFICI_11022 [Pestalotiopsis fici W106-1]
MSSNISDTKAGQADAQTSSFAKISNVWDTVKPNIEGAANSAVRRGKEWYQVSWLPTSLRGHKFRHTSLADPSSSIRLLKIEPGQASDVIRVSLHVVSLRDNPKYTALSYKWEKDSLINGFSERYLTSPEADEGLLDALKRYMRSPKQAYSSKAADEGIEKLFEEQSESDEEESDEKESDEEEGDEEESDEENSPKYIICDGRRKGIQANLYDALVQLRKSPKAEFYWMDAICLVQKKCDEKKAQLRIMGDIYRCAELVVVWLGQCPIFISPGIKTMLSTGMTTVLPYYHGYAQLGQQAPQTKSVDVRNTLLVMSMFYLATRGWFGRLWVLQEILLAREAVFMLGEHQMDQGTVLAAINWNGGLQEGEAVMGGTEELRCHYESMARYFTPHRTDTVLGENRNMEGLHDDYGVVGNWFLIYYTVLKYIPTSMLSPRPLFRQGYRWTLEQFLVACNARDWGKVVDFVIGGLSLILPESLKINQAIQVDEPAPPPLPPRPGNLEQAMVRRPQSGNVPKVNKGRLWSSLDEHLDAKAPELFLNLAACLLSQPHEVGLLSVAAMFGNPLSERPTWIPHPELPREQGGEAFAMQSGKAFAACTELSLEPEISSDGRSLSLHAAKLDTIEHKGPLVPLLPTPEIVLEYLEFALKLPKIDHFTGQPGIVAFAHASIGGSWGGQHPPPLEAANGFYYFLADIIRDLISKGKKQGNKKPQAVPPRPAASSQPNDTGGQQQPPSQDQVAKITKTYQALTKAYPGQPWPPLKNEAFSKDQDALSGRYAAAVSLAVMSGGRRLFITRGGCIGLGPNLLKEDDTVMLVPGFYVPYIFTSIDEHLRRKAERLLGKLRDIEAKGGSNKEQVEGMQAKLQELQDRMGTQDAWRLVGEAYVGGVMRGEAIEENRDRFERISIV